MMTLPEPPRRTSFAPGQLVTSESLRVDQEYHRRMRYLHNRVHGHGVAHGLEVGVEPGGVRVSPGTAVDAYGRELVVTEDRFVDVADEPALVDGPLDLVAVWAEVPDLAPGPDGEEQCTGWTEVPRLVLCASGDAGPEALLLARVRRGSDGEISVDTTGRRPWRRGVPEAHHRPRGRPVRGDLRARLRWDAGYVAGVRRIGPLRRTTQVASHQDGLGGPEQKVPGRTQYEAVTVELDAVHDRSFDEWADGSVTTAGTALAADFRRDLRIELHDASGQVVLAFDLFRCWVSQYQALPGLEGGGDASPAVLVRIECEGWVRDLSLPDPAAPVDA